MRAGAGDLNEAIYSQANAIFRGGEFQSQWDIVPIANGFLGIENQFDVVRATFTDGTNVPRIPPVRVGGGIYWRNDAWLARVRLLHAFAQNDIAPVAETPTPGYDDLRAEVSYTWKAAKPRPDQLSEMTFGLVGTNLLNQDIRNSVSYTKDQVLLPGRQRSIICEGQVLTWHHSVANSKASLWCCRALARPLRSGPRCYFTIRCRCAGTSFHRSKERLFSHAICRHGACS